MKNNLNRILFVFLLLILSVGAAAASDDVGDAMSADSFSISEADGAVSDSPDEILTVSVEDGNADAADYTHNLTASDVKKDYINGSSESKANILGTTDEEDNERYDGPVWYVDQDASFDDLASNDHLFTNIQDAIDEIGKDDYYAYNHCYGQLLIKSGTYTNPENIRVYIPIFGLLIKAVDGPVIITGSDEYIFNIDYCDVFFKGITFANINVTSSVITSTDWSGGLHFQDCDFINITAQGDGGAIFIHEKTIIEDCNFINITTQENGGAIYIDGEDTEVRNCNFINITTQDNGGAIYIDSEDTEVRNCQFINVTAQADGGAIYIDGQDTEVRNCQFINNTAKNGGAIYRNKSSTLEGNSYSGNTASESDSDDVFLATVWYVDAYYSGESDGSQDQPFTNIKSAIDTICDLYGDECIDDGHLFIKSGTYSGDDNIGFEININGLSIEAYGDEPVIISGENEYVYRIGGYNVTFKGITFSDISVDYHAFETTQWEDESNFENCTFKGITSESGSVIKIRGENHRITDCYFTDIKGGYGGAILIDSPNAEVSGSIFTNCSSENNGGAVCIESENATIEYCEFYDNSATCGGAVYVNGENARIVDNWFMDNEAEYGGAIFDYKKSTYIDDNNIFDGNNATFGNDIARPVMYVDVNEGPDGDGSQEHPFNNIRAAVHAALPNFVIKIRPGVYSGVNNTGIYSEIYNLTIESDGGQVIIQGSDVHNSMWHMIADDVTLRGLTFSNTTSVYEDFEQDGALVVRGSRMLIENCVFENINRATGSIIYAYNTFRDTVIRNSTFVNNKFKNAAVYFQSSGNLIENCTFINNTGEIHGAVWIHQVGSGDKYNVVSNSTFINNSGETGGAISADTKSIITNCNFADNNASGNGGAIYVGGNSEISNSIFDGNSANAGGSIYNGYYNLVLRNNTITNSKANVGKAIYDDGSIVDVIVVSANNSTITAEPHRAANVSIIVTDDMGNIIAGKNNVDVYADGVKIGSVKPSENSSILVTPTHEGSIVIEGKYKASGSNTVNKTGIVEFSEAYTGPFYVSCDGDDANDGSSQYPLKTFERAFDLASREGAVPAIYLYSGTYGLSGNLSILQSINITGLGNAIIDLNHNCRIFLRSSYVNISNVGFANGFVSGSGGAIYIGHSGDTIFNITLENCTFINNTARNDGGALWIAGTFRMEHDDMGYLKVNNCTFINNTAERGGAIYNQRSILISNCTFINNTANGYGGSIYNANNHGNAVLSHNTIINSTALLGKQIYDGRIYDGSELSNCYITVLNNDTVICSDGDALLVTITVTDDMGNNISGKYISLLVNGSVLTSDILVTEGFASVLIIPPVGTSIISVDYHARASIKNATVIYEGTPYDGPVHVSPYGSDDGDGSEQNPVKSIQSGVQLATGANRSDRTVLIESGNYNVCDMIISTPVTLVGRGNVVINGNNRPVFDFSTGDVKIENIAFINTKANPIVMGGANSEITNCSFTNTGAVQVKGQNCKIINCSFTNTLSADNGGAISLTANNIKVSGCNFTNTSSSSYGGAIYGSKQNITIENCNFLNVCSADNAGSIYIKGKNSIIRGCNFINVSSERWGGAIWVNEEYVKVDNCNFDNVSAEVNGGAIYLQKDYAEVTNCNFSNLKAGYAGAIYVYRSHVTIENCVFTNTSSRSSAGTIYVRVDYDNFHECDEVYIHDCSFINTHAVGNGSAIYIDKTAKIESCTFSNNTAWLGGAIYTDAYSYGTEIVDCTFDDTHAFNGGAVYLNSIYVGTIENYERNHQTFDLENGFIHDSDGNIYYMVKDSIIHHNFGDTVYYIDNYNDGWGPYIYVLQDDGSTLSGIDGYGDVELVNGHVVYGDDIIDSPDGIIKINTQIYFIWSDGNRYDLYYNSDGVLVDDYNWEYYLDDDGNLWDSDGGGPYHIDEEITFSDLGQRKVYSFDEYKDFIVISHPNYGNKIIDCKFENSTAETFGGAIYIEADKAVIDGVEIKNSATDEIGGALYWNGKYGQATSVTIEDCYSPFAGGGLYWIGEEGSLSNSYISGSSSYMGGGVYWTGNEGTLYNTTISDNSAQLGGGLYWIGEDGQAERVTISNNNATLAGGLYWAGEYGNLHDSIISANNATDGGGILWEGKHSTVDGVEITYNHADNHGGGLAYRDFTKDNSTEGSEIVDDPIIIIIINTLQAINDNEGEHIDELDLDLKNLIIEDNTEGDDDSNTPTELSTDLTPEDFYVNQVEVKDGVRYLSNGDLAFCMDYTRMGTVNSNRLVASTAVGTTAAGEDIDNSYHVYNVIDGSDVSEYIKLLIYKYDYIIDNPQYLQSLIWEFTNGKYWTSDNRYIMNVTYLVDVNGTTIPDVGAWKRVGREIWTYNFTTYINTESRGQSLYGVHYLKSPLVNVTINITKNWVDSYYTQFRPKNITITLWRSSNGSAFEYVTNVTLNSTNRWKYSFVDMPVFDENGNAYIYNITENQLENYTTTVKYGQDSDYNITITNTFRTSVSVKKIWNDTNDVDHVRPDNVTITLQRSYGWGWSYVTSIQLNESNSLVLYISAAG